MFGIQLRRTPTPNANGHPPANGTYRNGNDHLIHLHTVDKVFQTAAGPFRALHQVNLEVDRGEFVAVIGKSGSGKSTLINMVTGIDRPTAGQVFVGDTPVHTLGESQLAVWRGRNVGIIFQFFQLLPTLTIVENVMLPMDFGGIGTNRERQERAMHLLAQMEMADHAHKLPSAVSGGQQQRVAIARALANDPPILVADEPTGNLDSRTADTVFALFAGLVAEGKTILMVTHDRDLARRATRTVIIADGEIIEEQLAHVFPDLTEDQLVRTTREIDLQKYPAGAEIIHAGAAADRFYLVTKGTVEVVVPTDQGGEVVATRLERGQYFGEIELLRGGPNLATIRAAATGEAEVAAMDREAFLALVAESTGTRQALEHIAQSRLAENAAYRVRNGHA